MYMYVNCFHVVFIQNKDNQTLFKLPHIPFIAIWTNLLFQMMYMFMVGRKCLVTGRLQRYWFNGYYYTSACGLLIVNCS